MEQTEEFKPRIQEVSPGDRQGMNYVRSLFSEGRTAEGVAELQSMIARDPEDVRPVMALGLQNLRQRQFESAAQLFERAMELDPDNEAPALLAAQVGLRGGNPEYSEANFHKALDKNPKSIAALRGLSRLHLRNDKPEAAAEVLERAIDIDPQSQILRSRAATVLIRLERYDEAREHLEYSFSLHPTDAATAAMLATTYRNLGRHGDALRVLREVLMQAPDNPQALVAMGDLLVSQGSFVEAEQALRRVVQHEGSAAGGVAGFGGGGRFPQQPQGGFGPAQGAPAGGTAGLAGGVAQGRGGGGQIISRIAGFLRNRPRLVARILLVRALIPQDKIGEARELLNTMPRTGNTGAVVQRLYGDAFAAERNFDAAEESYRAALMHGEDGEARLREIDERLEAGEFAPQERLRLYTDAIDREQKARLDQLEE